MSFLGKVIGSILGTLLLMFIFILLLIAAWWLIWLWLPFLYIFTGIGFIGLFIFLYYEIYTIFFKDL